MIRSNFTTHFDVAGSYRFCSWNDIMLVKWEREADGESVGCLEELVRQFQGRHPDGRQSGVHIIAEGVGLPTAEARTRLMSLIKRGSEHFGAVGIVILGTGFVASAVRSFLTGLRLIAPRSFDFRLHGRSADVLKWFPAAHARHTGQTIDIAQFGRVLGSFERGSPF